MKKNGLVLSTGFALFSMFFGSGNLVFPITVGLQSEGHYLLAAVGILLTGVVVPFLGVFAMSLFQGQLDTFFKLFGKTGLFWFSLVSLSLMGPFGVLARCLTVAHGAFQLIFPSVSLTLFSLFMCLLLFSLTLNKTRLLNILGTFLTPALLIAIFAIAFSALTTDFTTGQVISTQQITGLKAFTNGFFQGYQTMDLLAAFFFSTFVIQQLQNKFRAKDETLSFQVFTKASLIGATILSVVYFVLVILGHRYAPFLINEAPQEMFGKIAMATLGSVAAPCVCLAVIGACLTTALVLTSLFADFLKEQVSKNKLSQKSSLVITLLIGFAVSNLEFAGIAKFLAPILETLYPALIVLTLINILHKLSSFKISYWPVPLTLVLKLYGL